MVGVDPFWKGNERGGRSKAKQYIRYQKREKMVKTSKTSKPTSCELQE